MISKLRAIIYPTLAALPIIAGIILLLPAKPVYAFHASSCSDVNTPLSSFVYEGVARNKAAYQSVTDQTGVPWEMLAAIHYRETSFGRTNPSNGQGIFQFVNGGGGPYPYTGTEVSEAEFRRQLKYMADRVQDDYVWRNTPNPASVTRRKLVPLEQNDELVKNTLYSYNGRSTTYADQAEHFGFDKTKTPYEGSPYVMNRFDCKRARMGIITKDYGSLDGRDTRYGAFTIFTRLRDIVLLRNQDNGRIYVVDKEKNTKYYVASLDAYKAWGFNLLGGADNVTPAALDKFQDGGSLQRTAYERGTGKAYFIDGQTAYYIPNSNTVRIWGLSLSGTPWLPSGLIQSLPNDRLKPLVKSPVGSEIYMMDSEVLRRYSNPTILSAWENSSGSTQISEAYFCTGGTTGANCTFRWPAGDAIGYPKASSPDTSKVYFINNGNKHWIASSGINAVYDGAISTLSQNTLDRFSDAPNASVLITQTYSPKIYLLNQNQYNHIASPEYLRRFRPNSSPGTTVVTSSFLSLLTEGARLDTATATDGNKTYLIKDGAKYELKNGLDIAYANFETPVSLNPSTLALYQTNSASPFVSSSETNKIFFVDGAGVKHHITSINQLLLLKDGSSYGVDQLANQLLDSIPTGPPMQPGFSVGAANYLFDAGAYHKITSAEWKFNFDLALPANSLNWFSDRGDLADKFILGSELGVIRGGSLFTTTNLKLADVWGVNSQSPRISSRLSAYLDKSALSPLVKSVDSSNPRIYFYDGAKLFYVPSIAALRTLNYSRFSGVTRLSESEIASLYSGDVASYTLSYDNGIIDRGARRRFSNVATATAWDAVNNTIYSQKLIDLLSQKTNSTSVGRLITSSETSKWFCMEAGEKRWVTSFAALAGSSCNGEGLSSVSNDLLIQIPTGATIR